MKEEEIDLIVENAAFLLFCAQSSCNLLITNFEGGRSQFYFSMFEQMVVDSKKDKLNHFLLALTLRLMCSCKHEGQDKSSFPSSSLITQAPRSTLIMWFVYFECYLYSEGVY